MISKLKKVRLEKVKLLNIKSNLKVNNENPIAIKLSLTNSK